MTERPKKVTIPFLPEWREKMLSGHKTATSRTKRYGNVGETFEAFGTTFELVEVRQLALRDIAADYYSLEGCATAETFRRVWEKIHQKRGYIGSDMVWFHVFRRVPDVEVKL